MRVVSPAAQVITEGVMMTAPETVEVRETENPLMAGRLVLRV